VQEVMTVKAALGMIVRSLDSDTDVLRFVENAEKHGRKLDCVIVAYTLRLDPRVELSLSKKLPFFSIDIKNPQYCYEQLRRRGVSATAMETLLKCPIDTKGGLVPYGLNRTFVVIEALLRGMDILFFADSDVYTTVLKKTPEGTITEEEEDFFGAHFEYLNSGSQITTGEYSGYNILPPASFDGMEDLLDGLQKANMLEYWQSSEKHRCIAVQPAERVAMPCTKILGGNTAIKLEVFSKLPPFFSSHYALDGELFLCRGEDTVLGVEIAKSGTICTDIGFNPLHDTYKDYPAEPDLRGDSATQDRFYYACTGWVGRNPFLNHLLGNDLQSTREYQRVRLERGLRALAGYTSNQRFNSVLRNFDVSWGNAGRYIVEYEQVLEAWRELTERAYA